MNHENTDATGEEKSADSSPDDSRTDADRAGTTGTQPNAPDAHAADQRVVGRGRWIAGAAAALGVALFAVPLIRGPEVSSDGSGESTSGGATCSAAKGIANFDFTLKDVNHADVRLSDFKGKVILLNFWATWCGPCKVEIPEFVQAYNDYRDRGFVILGVLSQDDPSADDLQGFARQWGMNYPIMREHGEFEEAFGSLWAIPTSFIIDRHGSICTKHMGPMSKEMLEREIKRLL